MIDVLVLSQNFITYSSLQDIEKALWFSLDFRLQLYVALSSLAPHLTSRGKK